MAILLPSLCVAFAAVCVWLTVRIINRREIWALRIAFVLAMAMAAALAVAFLGPFDLYVRYP